MIERIEVFPDPDFPINKTFFFSVILYLKKNYNLVVNYNSLATHTRLDFLSHKILFKIHMRIGIHLNYHFIQQLKTLTSNTHLNLFDIVERN